MKINIVSDRLYHGISINGDVVNGFDLSSFPEGAHFSASDEMTDAGIYGVERIDGELYVTLGQYGLNYECPSSSGGHDWRGTGEWIDADEYDPDRCYIVATSAPEGAEYMRRQNGWTVAMPETEESAA
ncbi:hypothetical protein [Vreelandella boliviensis]|uniref:hypothetical protein n=1 Tax=Vreelandella boliviensis TaxID=223527 RepID=UPI001B8B14EF|nr:hypothetical protein [Halomonas boliviensis]MBS3670211.1 hypothetical protein [Halomonas boliviensis]